MGFCCQYLLVVDAADLMTADIDQITFVAALDSDQVRHHVAFLERRALALQQQRAVQLQERFDVLGIGQALGIRGWRKRLDVTLLRVLRIGMLPIVDDMTGAARNVGAVREHGVTRVLQVARRAAPDAGTFERMRLAVEGFAPFGGKSAERGILRAVAM